jgi:hypothetical protein
MNFTNFEKIRDVRLEANGNTYRLELFDIGHRMPSASQWALAYKFSLVKGKVQTVIFQGDDYGCSPCHGIDSDDSVRGLLNFLTLKPGDTDKEYFEKYTSAQLEWCQSSDCEQLQCDYTVEDDDHHYWGILRHWHESKDAAKVRKAIHSLWDAKDSLRYTANGATNEEHEDAINTINGILFGEGDESGLYQKYFEMDSIED